jgi:hypothetical protein
MHASLAFDDAYRIVQACTVRASAAHLRWRHAQRMLAPPEQPPQHSERHPTKPNRPKSKGRSEVRTAREFAPSRSSALHVLVGRILHLDAVGCRGVRLCGVRFIVDIAIRLRCTALYYVARCCTTLQHVALRLSCNMLRYSASATPRSPLVARASAVPSAPRRVRCGKPSCSRCASLLNALPSWWRIIT